MKTVIVLENSLAVTPQACCRLSSREKNRINLSARETARVIMETLARNDCVYYPAWTLKVRRDPVVAILLRQQKRAGFQVCLPARVKPSLSLQRQPELARNCPVVIGGFALQLIAVYAAHPLLIRIPCGRRWQRELQAQLLKSYRAEHPVTLFSGRPGITEPSWQGKLAAWSVTPSMGTKGWLSLSPAEGRGMEDLLTVMAVLRSEQGCPWDGAQTSNSLRQYLVEEAYEVIAAIDAGDDKALVEELGDLLLQVVFHCQIAAEAGRFDFAAVVETIVQKLLRRHPHVFGSGRADNAGEVKIIWEQIKAEERGEGGSNELIYVDEALPSLLKAWKVQKKAARVGFDWPTVTGPLEKAREELSELEEALASKVQPEIETELGDYLFTMVNLSRFLDVNPELALGKAIVKFRERFRYVAAQAAATGRPLASFSLAEMDRWWEEAKKNS